KRLIKVLTECSVDLVGKASILSHQTKLDARRQRLPSQVLFFNRAKQLVVPLLISNLSRRFEASTVSRPSFRTVKYFPMTRRLIVSILRFAMRVYFRRVEVLGAEHVPAKSPVIFVLNHPNALVDPAVLLCLTPRRVSFLAKAPLFRMPVLGYF